MGRLSTRLLAGWVLALAAVAAQAGEVVGFDSGDGQLRITAHWFAADAAGPRPAVIALHGCNGLSDDKGRLNPVWRRHAAYFNAEGVHFLAVDSFGPRGQRSICEIPNARRTVDEEMRRDDVFAAMKWLQAQPAVDASRIVVAGWSHGAQTVLSVLDATDKVVQAQPVKPRAAVAFYPGCSRFVRMFNYELSAPLLLMIGELDDWTPAAACTALGRRLAKPGQPAFEMTVYPGSYHAFDGLVPVRVRDNIGNTRSGKATVGGNAQAREQSHARMFEFLAAQLDQPLLLSHEQRLRLKP
jgi:dienelactone hydrolase